MTAELGSFSIDVLVVVGGALLLLALLLGARQLLEIVPLSKARRETLARVGPVAGAMVALLYCLWSVRLLFQSAPTYMPLLVGLVLVGFTVASWSALRDFIAGVFVKAGRVCRDGDHVRIADVEGRIVRMGQRVLVLETSDGDEAIVPYSQVARERLLRTSGGDAVTPHVFNASRPASLPLAELKATVRRSALSVHWCAVSREPDVAVDDDGRLEITVYSIDADRGFEIEAAVQSALTSSAAATESARPKRPGTQA